MTSKISCFKLIREDIRHRGWYAALAGVVLFLLMPVNALLYLGRLLDSSPGYTFASDLLREQLLSHFPGLINGSWRALLEMAIAGLAVLCALSGFAHIHSREKLDFFHALPAKRGTWFAVTVFSGWLMFLIPYAVCTGLTIAVGAAQGAMTVPLFLLCLRAFAEGVLAFLVIYATGILAAVLTGRTMLSLLGTLAVAVYPFLVIGLITALQALFFASYYSGSGSIADRLAGWLSPALIFYRLTGGSFLTDQAGAACLTAALLTAALLAAAAVLYRFYRSEAAGSALAFRAAAPVFKVLLCIPGSIFLSMMVQNFAGVSGVSWTIGLSLLIVVILCGVMEFLYQQDLKLLLRGWRSSLISIAGTAAVLLFLQFDLAGYDTWLPEEDQVESMTFRPDSLEQYFQYYQYPDSFFEETGGSAEPLRSPVYTTDTAGLLELTKSGVDNLEQGFTPQAVISSQDSGALQDDYVNTVFVFRMKSGRTVLRQYCVERAAALDALSALCEDDAFRQGLFPVFQIDPDTVRTVSLADVYGIPEETELTPEEISGLLEVYRKDVMKADIRALDSETPAGELYLDVSSSDLESPGDPVIGGTDGFSGGNTDTALLATQTAGPDAAPAETEEALLSLVGFYLYPEYTDTLEYLEDCGYTLRTEVDPEDVDRIDVTLSKSSVQSGKYGELLSRLSDKAEYIQPRSSDGQLSVTEPGDIALVLDYLEPFGQRIIGAGSGSPDYADITYKDGNGYYGFRLK